MADLNPYETLGIDPDATPEQVDKAYKRKAKDNHPDRGGDVEDFHAVQKSYDLLRDSESREHYDRTGSWEDKRQDQTASAVMQIIGGVFTSVMSECNDHTKIDILDGMRKMVKKTIADFKKQLPSIKTLIKKLLDVASRFTRDEGNNFIKRIVEDQCYTVQEELARLNKTISEHQQALDIISQHKYRFDAPTFQERISLPSSFWDCFGSTLDRDKECDHKIDSRTNRCSVCGRSELEIESKTRGRS